MDFLPTSEAELEAQIDAEFNSSAETPEPKKSKAEKVRVDAEYIPPNDDDDSVIDACEYVIQTYINPVAAAFGVRPLNETEVGKLSGNIADIAACYPNFGMDKLTPKKAAFGGLLLTVLGIGAPRIIENLQGQNMRNVTPQADRENPAEDGPEEGAPLYG